MPSDYVCNYAKFCDSYNKEAMKCQFLYKFCPLKKDFEEEDRKLKGIEDIEFATKGIEECMEDRVLFKREVKDGNN